MLTTVQLSDLLDVAKKYNVKRLKIDDLEVEFNLEPIHTENPPVQDLGKILADEMPSDEEMLYHSVPPLEVPPKDGE